MIQLIKHVLAVELKIKNDWNHQFQIWNLAIYRWLDCSLFMIPFVLTINATFASDSTKIDPSTLVLLLAVIRSWRSACQNNISIYT